VPPPGLRGITFGPHSSVPVSDFAELCFTVDKDGDVAFLERQPQTWTQ